LEGLAMEDVGIFYGHLVHFTVSCYIFWTFGIVRGDLVYFSRFGISTLYSCVVVYFSKGTTVAVQKSAKFFAIKKSPKVGTMVARWSIFKPEIPIRVNFGVSCN
jgi:hypothetical protein